MTRRSHDHGDRIAVMQEGRFLQVGHPREIYETPSCLFVAGFIGDVNLFKVRLKSINRTM